ncbi:MAG: hypothetical protein HOK67_06645 [Deltaproteobacteria bacterium]|nr:hypothetical protein [Deltaproteobacteria bacterium]MBT6499565.1 hypothetical protein [Deltaproteobacteria bacterium]
MHQYIETVRNEVEAAAGTESYLAGTLFLRIHRDLGYEDEGAWKITTKEDFENVQHKVMNSIGKSRDFNLKDEILAWQIAILRDVGKEFYNWWIDYKDERFRADDCFRDGESCIALEASCEKLNENPTEVFTALLEVELILTRLATSCNTVVMQMDRFWQFKFKNRKKAPENNFTCKRIESESQQTILYKSVQTLKKISEMCKTFGKQLAGAEHLLWMIPHHMLESMIHALNQFLDFEYIEETDLALSKWLDDIFPERLPAGQPNPTYQNGLHHKVIANLTQATQCMVQQTVKKNDVFVQRDEIMRPYIQEVMEKVKQIELQNLNADKEQSLREQQQR